MPRFFLHLSYKGSAYAGWQIQENAISVQQKLNEALSTLVGQPVLSTGCGRTDTGVHARQFYAHIDLSEQEYDQFRFLYGLNALLPLDISVHEMIGVKADAHARFDAVKRSYEYFITTAKNPFIKEFAMFSYTKPDLDKMNEACRYLLFEGDFSAFSKSNTQVKTNICNIQQAQWELRNGLYVFNISADRFLRGMVRALVGTLLEIGTGKNKPEYINEILASKDRSVAGVTVPACGLYLSQVEYPFIPSNVPLPFPA